MVVISIGKTTPAAIVIVSVLLCAGPVAVRAETSWVPGVIGQAPVALADEVLVAVIDSGLDYQHPDIDPALIWRNEADPPNGLDDDGNGYVDDLIGWDFIDDDNNPWDSHGHGTFVTGLLAATRDNGTGIDGVTNNVRIMPLRALNSGGYGDGLALAKAVFYAVEQGARVINLSLGRLGIDVVDLAITRLAAERDVIVVIAAGNQAYDVTKMGPPGINLPGRTTLIVGASDRQDQMAEFSNLGPLIDVAAPGVDVVSLRARRTDFNWTSHVKDYVPGSGFRGERAQLYQSSGTSFSAPLVAGLAAELRARYPHLDAHTIIRMIRQSSVDIDDPGLDYRSGYGRIDINQALQLSPEFYVTAHISGVAVVQGKRGPAVEVSGTADADAFRRAEISLGQGPDPQKWARKTYRVQATRDGPLALIDATELQGASAWTIRLRVEHRSGREREHRFALNLN